MDEDNKDEIIDLMSKCLMDCREYLSNELQLDDPQWRKQRISEVINKIDETDRVARLLGG